VPRLASKSVKTELPTFVEPMMAKLVTQRPRGDWIYEIKHDGYRALVLIAGKEIKVLSRNEKDFGHRFPEAVESFSKLKIQDAIIDGEIVALDDQGRSSFQLLQQYFMGKQKPSLAFYAFDLLRLNREDLQHLPIEERKAKLEDLLKKPRGIIRYSISFTENIDALLEKVRELGLEGLIGKRSGSKYEPGQRSGSWIKLKVLQEQEFVIGGFTPPDGSRKYFGSILVGVFEGKHFKFSGRVGTGFNEKTLKSLYTQLKRIEIDKPPFFDLPTGGRSRWDKGLTIAEMKRSIWVKPEVVCLIKFSGWTQDDRLRQPVYLGLREDKNPNDVVKENAAETVNR
jgi:bifunctional non-homologous end joining protein LigD